MRKKPPLPFSLFVIQLFRHGSIHTMYPLQLMYPFLLLTEQLSFFFNFLMLIHFWYIFYLQLNSNSMTLDLILELKIWNRWIINLKITQRFLSEIKTWIEVLLLDYNSRGSYLTKCTEAINYSQVDASSKNIQMART